MVIDRRAEEWLRACFRHVAMSRYEAKIEARRHISMVVNGRNPCQKCWSGERPNVFRCQADGRHWHMGHSRIRP